MIHKGRRLPRDPRIAWVPSAANSAATMETETHMNNHKLLSTAVLSACLAAAGTAFAQSGPQGPQPIGPATQDAPHAGRHGHFEGRHFMKPTDEVEARLAYIKTALKITPAQESAWQAYANLSRQNARDM